MPVTIQHASSYDDAFAHRFARMLKGEIASLGTNIGIAKNRSRNLRKRMRQENQRLRRRPQPGRTIVGIKRIRLRTLAHGGGSGDRPLDILSCPGSAETFTSPDSLLFVTSRSAPRLTEYHR